MSAITKVLSSGRTYKADSKEAFWHEMMLATYSGGDIIEIFDIAPSCLSKALNEYRKEYLKFFKQMLREVQKGFYYYKETGETYQADQVIYSGDNETKSLSQICKEVKSKSISFDLLQHYYDVCSEPDLCGVMRREDVL